MIINVGDVVKPKVCYRGKYKNFDGEVVKIRKAHAIIRTIKYDHDIRMKLVNLEKVK